MKTESLDSIIFLKDDTIKNSVAQQKERRKETRQYNLESHCVLNPKVKARYKELPEMLTMLGHRTL